MKKRLFRVAILIACLALALLLTASVLAASTTKSLSTNFTLVNLGSNTAHVNINYYQENGNPWTGSSYPTATLAANGGQVIIRQYFDTLTAGRGSVVIDSDEELGAVVQILARGQTATSGAYSGWQQGSGQIYLPLVVRRLTGASGLSNTQIMIQNTDTAADATVDINFVAAAGSAAPASWSKLNVVIPPGATEYYDIEEETNLGVGWFGSAEVDAGLGKVAVIANIFAGPNALQTYNGFPVESVGTGWAVPLFASRLAAGNLNTPVTVQNLSGGNIPAAAISLNCIAAPGTGLSNFNLSNPGIIANKGSYSINPVTNMSIPGNWYGSCIVDSGAYNTVVYVQMRKPGVSDETGAFEAFRTNSTDTTVFVPLAAKRLPTASTSIVFQNLGSVDAHVRLTYTRSPESAVGAASYVFNNVLIPANGGQLPQNLRLVGTQPSIPSGWYGTLRVEDDPGEPTAPQPIVGFVQITDIQGTLGDTLMVYDAFGK
jgi:hypothetical protein